MEPWACSLIGQGKTPVSHGPQCFVAAQGCQLLDYSSTLSPGLGGQGLQHLLADSDHLHCRALQSLVIFSLSPCDAIRKPSPVQLSASRVSEEDCQAQCGKVKQLVNSFPCAALSR
jgi:hypothetical protein